LFDLKFAQCCSERFVETIALVFLGQVSAENESATQRRHARPVIALLERRTI